MSGLGLAPIWLIRALAGPLSSVPLCRVSLIIKLQTATLGPPAQTLPPPWGGASRGKLRPREAGGHSFQPPATVALGSGAQPTLCDRKLGFPRDRALPPSLLSWYAVSKHSLILCLRPLPQPQLLPGVSARPHPGSLSSFTPLPQCTSLAAQGHTSLMLRTKPVTRALGSEEAGNWHQVLLAIAGSFQVPSATVYWGSGNSIHLKFPQAGRPAGGPGTGSCVGLKGRQSPH